MKHLKILWMVIVMLTMLLAPPLQAQFNPQSVKVAWDANPETNLVDYAVSYGVVGSGNTNTATVVHVPNQSAFTNQIDNLELGKEHWFYVTARNSYNLVSDPSVTLLYTTPSAPAAPATIRLETQVLASLTPEGPYEQIATYETLIPATEDEQFYRTMVSAKLVDPNKTQVVTMSAPTPPPIPGS